ncbi:MAG: adenylate/guanylate cyclase domain-containing protein [Flavobacteriales bacterium]
MYKPLLLVLLLGSFPASTAAQLNIDSLRTIWENPDSAATARYSALEWIIGEGMYSAPPDSELALARKLVSFSRQNKLRKQEGYALNMCGIFHEHLSELDSSEAAYLGSLKIITEVKDSSGMSMVLNNLGNVVSTKGDYPGAIVHYTNCLRIAEAKGDSACMARVVGNMGTIYAAQGDIPVAMEHYKRRIALADAIGDKQCAEEAWICMALAHITLKDRASARACYAKALRMAREIDDISGVTVVLGNLGEMLVDEGDHVRGLAYLDSGLVLAEQQNDPAMIVATLAVKARSHLLQGLLDQAQAEASKAMLMARGIGNVDVLRDAAGISYKVLKARGDVSGALAMHEFFITLRDSVKNQENKKAILQQQFQYAYDKKEALLTAEQEKKNAIAAEELRRKNLQRNAFIGGFGLMLLLAGVFFTQRNRISKEKARSEELLLNILPAEVAEELKAKGEADAVQIDQVTVLFTDFKGFTAMSEKLTARELVADIHECFSAFDAITSKHGIEKIKTIGDAYMAAGGLPTPNSTHALDVVKAALEIRDFIAEGKARKVAAGLPYFEVRIGVHTGPVVAGIVGVKKFAYDIWGDTVNIASRMESSGEVGQVNISESTYALVREQAGRLFDFTPRGKVQAKGKGEMEMYFVGPSTSSA